jgi:type I restriction enzyme S subunit
MLKKNNWKRVKLGQVTYESRARLGAPLVDARPVYGVDRHLGLAPAAKYTSDNLERYKLLERGMFAYNPMRLNIGSIGYCSQRHAPGLVSPDYVVFGCRDEELMPDFMRYVVEGPAWTQWTTSAGVGSVRVRIYYKELLNLEFGLPPLSEQLTIAHILGTLDDKIELNRRMNETLESLARALFKSWFVDFDPVRAKAAGRQPAGMDAETASLFPDAFEETELGEIPQGWKAGVLEDLLILQRGFDLPTPLRTPGPYPVVAASGPSGTHCRYMVKGPGVTTGRSGVLGKVFFVHEDYWPLNTSLWVKEFRVSRPLHAYFLLKDLDFETFNAGSAVPTLNRNHVHNLPVVVPPAQVVQAFEKTATPVFSAIRSNEKQTDTLASIRDTLLPKLLSGEVRVDPHASGGHANAHEKSETVTKTGHG